MLFNIFSVIEKYGYQNRAGDKTVSRVLRRFQDSGMLEVSWRKFKIHDYNYLVSIAGAQITY